MQEGTGQVRGDQPVTGTRQAWARALFIPVSLLLLVSAAVVVPLPVYAERPGESLDISECVTVEDPGAGPITGDLLLTFATLRRATIFDLVRSIRADDVLLRPVERVIPPDVVPSDYFAHGRQVFDSVGLTAAAVGLDRAGYPEPAHVTGDGARIVRTLDGFPADGALEPDDVIIGADGQPIHTSDQLRDVILRGDSLDLQVHRGGEVEVVSITPTRSDIGGEPRPVIGAELQTVNPQVTLPVDIEIRAGRIGGPSAGLMIALGVYDAVAEENLVAGHRIAGTGEMNAAGEVGRIGALPLKVIAADRQGASVFLVPASQADSARAALPAGSDLHVIGVENIDEAIAAVRNLPPADGDLPHVRFRQCSERVVSARQADQPRPER